MTPAATSLTAVVLNTVTAMLAYQQQQRVDSVTDLHAIAASLFKIVVGVLLRRRVERWP